MRACIKVKFKDVLGNEITCHEDSAIHSKGTYNGNFGKLLV